MRLSRRLRKPKANSRLKTSSLSMARPISEAQEEDSLAKALGPACLAAPWPRPAGITTKIPTAALEQEEVTVRPRTARTRAAMNRTSTTTTTATRGRRATDLDPSCRRPDPRTVARTARPRLISIRHRAGTTTAQEERCLRRIARTRTTSKATAPNRDATRSPRSRSRGCLTVSRSLDTHSSSRITITSACSYYLIFSSRISCQGGHSATILCCASTLTLLLSTRRCACVDETEGNNIPACLRLHKQSLPRQYLQEG